MITMTEKEMDMQVGRNIRQSRWANKMTQQQLAEAVGVKFQQIQKYETGANRVSASRLMLIANALKTTVPALFQGLIANDTDEIRITDRGEANLLHDYRVLGEKAQSMVLDVAAQLVDITVEQVAAQ